MIETAGLAAQQLWFDQARALYVPASSRAYSNFMIDTSDMTDMMTNEEWNSIPEAQRTFAQPLPAAKVFNTTLVNELQIELGMEKAYVARLKELEAAVAADSDRCEPQGAARWREVRVGAVHRLDEGAVRAQGSRNVLDRLKKAGATSTLSWSAPPDSKGNIALKILADRD